MKTLKFRLIKQPKKKWMIQIKKWKWSFLGWRGYYYFGFKNLLRGYVFSPYVFSTKKKAISFLKEENPKVLNFIECDKIKYQSDGKNKNQKVSSKKKHS